MFVSCIGNMVEQGCNWRTVLIWMCTFWCPCQRVDFITCAQVQAYASFSSWGAQLKLTNGGVTKVSPNTKPWQGELLTFLSGTWKAISLGINVVSKD